MKCVKCQYQLNGDEVMCPNCGHIIDLEEKPIKINKVKRFFVNILHNTKQFFIDIFKHKSINNLLTLIIIFLSVITIALLYFVFIK